jgi:YjbE family integral membrane protein
MVIITYCNARRHCTSGNLTSQSIPLQQFTIHLDCPAIGSADLQVTEGDAVELLSSQFLAALFAIVIIDLVLAGDNAIVIALAARSLPAHLQRRAILWGTFGAIVVRTSMTLVVVWLLQIPGLLFVGGALLVWIAYKLLLPEKSQEEGVGAVAAHSFWGAIRTVVVADTIMGLDNVLAVAGAAHGSFVLVTLGLLISIPIVVWGSTLILRVVERYPAFVYVGAGVLAWTAVKMMTAEPALADYFQAHRLIVPLLFVLVVGGVLWFGLAANHRKLESRISARVARLSAQWARDAASVNVPSGEVPMIKVLVPVDASRNAQHAVRHVIREFRKNPGFEVHLLNVQAPFSRHVAQFVAKKDRDQYHREQSEAVLAPLVAMLDEFGIPHAEHVKVGAKAATIADEARRLQCDHIVMATARKNSITRMVDASVTNKVLDLTSVPVEVVVGDSVSKLERFGIPVGLGAGLGALALLAAD